MTNRSISMDLDFSEEQVMLRDTAKGICSEYVTSASIRELENDELGYSAPFWQQLAELGIAGLNVPEAYGGMQWGMLEAAVVYEEFGRSLASTPHFQSCVLSAKVLELAGSEAIKTQWLPAIAAGEAIITPAWTEAGGGFDAVGVQLSADKQGETYSLNGTKILVPFARAASRLLVLARNGDQMLGALVDPQADGVTLAYEKNHASQPVFQVDFKNVQVSAADVMADDFWLHWDQAVNRSIVALAAQAIGGAEAIHAMTVDYAKQRVQFGKQIGAFQSIAHYLADLSVEIEGAKVLVYQAAWALDNNKPWQQLALMAKLQACDVFRKASATGVQVHGGYGFTLEGDPQLYFRRAKFQQVTYWDSAYLENRIADAVLAA
ncbi:MAG: acyl-CoA/acyl-ACP dehydrogenase [Pseudomonadales bacterium]|nr:acyl-CoA/acyl-ACP dehydrogenase [Pseudomonadales bacterium]